MSYFNGLQALETAEYLTAHLDKLGGPESYNHYAVGWAHAMNTPLPVDQAGGLALRRHPQRHHRPLAEGDQGQGRDPLAVPPRHRRGADHPRGGGHSRSRSRSTASTQDPIDGVSMLYTFNDAKAAEHHETQYFEIMGNRGIYHKGWTAVTKHYTPWIT